MKENFEFIFCGNERCRKKRRMKMTLLYYGLWTERENEIGSEIHIWAP